MSTFNGTDKAIAFLFDMVSNIANDYDETATYSVNDYAIHEGVLYKCTSAITTAETFTPAHWAAVLIMEEVAAGGGGGGGSTTLAGLSDVALSAVSNGDVLTYDSSLNKWKNAVGGGGSSGHTYSRNEQVVGTWIDGKTLYEKTLDIPAIAANDYTTVAHNVTNFDKFIRVEVFLNDCSFSGDYNRPDNVQKEFYVQTVATGVFVRAFQQAVTSGYAIIQYTKSSS